MRHTHWLTIAALLAALASPYHETSQASELWVGAAAADITPQGPIPLTGFSNVRISRTIHSRCKANVLALEAREGERIVDQAIVVACDLCVIRAGIQDGFRRHLAGRLPGFDLAKLFLTATHTHAAPVLLQERYEDYGDAMQPKDYVPFLYERMADAVVAAWENRAPGAVAWGLGHAVVGRNRRAVFSDGSAAMHGDTAKPTFRRIEGYEDHSIDFLFFFNGRKELKAAAVTLACPSQSVGGNSLSADFWHDARRLLQERHGDDLCVLGLCAPAGDQSPRVMYRQKSEARMEKLRGLTQTQELGRRIADAFDDVLQVVRADIRTDVPFMHSVERFDVPGRKVTDAEYARAKERYDALAAKQKLGGGDYWSMNFFKLTCDRFEAQQRADPANPVEMHVMRLGEVAIATNPYELFLDYGVQIQARSPAEQTILIQLASPLEAAYYVPTPRALEGGGYSAIVEQSLVGPEGGQVLVERTVKSITELFEETKP